MANKYKVLKDKHSKEVNAFPMFFAFSDKQFQEGLKKFGLKESEKDKLVKTVAGGFILMADVKKFNEMFAKHDKELAKEIENDKTGKGFIADMFSYELANHEYGYSYDANPALRALGLSNKRVQKTPKLKTGFEIAVERCKD